MGLALYTAAATATFMQCFPTASAYVPSGPFVDVKNCLTPNCPDIQENELYPKINLALGEFSYFNASFYERYFSSVKNNQEYLRFRKDDLRDKSLVVSAGYDHNGALDPKYISHIINEFGKNFDVKYVVANSVEEICEYIRESSEVGKLTSVVINAHGNFKNIAISAPGTETGTLNETTDFEKCFSGLDPTGKIILISGMTGAPNEGNLKDNIAQKIATSAKREVIAPTEIVFANKIKVSNGDDLYLFHSSKDRSSRNIFKLFRPVYQKCQQVFENTLHLREKEAIKSIKTNLLQKGLISESIGFEETQEYLRFCEDDPKTKLLFLTAEADHNGALSPNNNEELYGALADQFDLKYKIIYTYEEICKQIEEGSKLGNLGYVVLNMHGNPKGMCFANDCRLLSDWIHKSDIKDWENCFKGVDHTGKIILLSCSTADSEEIPLSETIAGLISKIAKKTVVAPNELLYSNYVELTSKDNVELHHPSAKFYYLKKLFFQTHDNIFKEIKPQD